MPRGSIYTPVLELGPQHHNRDGLVGPNSILVVYMDSLGYNHWLANEFAFSLAPTCRPATLTRGSSLPLASSVQSAPTRKSL